MTLVLRNKRGTFICICLIFLLSVNCVDLGASSFVVGKQRYVIAVWSIEDGLPQNSVTGLLQTRDGYIWLGTQTGLVRFDGVRLQVYNRWNTPGLKNDHILCLYEDKNGALWVGTDGGGISRLKDGNWSVYTTKQGLSNNTVRAITADKDNTLWIGTDNELNRWKDEKIKAYTVENGLSAYTVSSLCPDSGGTLWIGTVGGGIDLMKNGQFLPRPPSLENTLAGAEVTVLHRDSSGTFRVGTEDGLYCPKTKKYFFPGNSIQAILEDSSGTLWVGTDGEGIYRLTKDGDMITSITVRQGLPDDFIHSLAEDREGNIWIGTYTVGLVRLKQSRVGSITTGNGLPENRVHTVLQDHEGFLWVGSRKGLSKIKNNTVIRTFTAADGLSGSKVSTLFLDKEKNLWIGTGSGLDRVKLSGGGFQVSGYTTDDGLCSNNITAIFQDRAGSLWIGTPAGLNRLKDGQFTTYGQEAGLSAVTIRTIGEDREGNLLVGTRAGLFLFTDGKFRHFTAQTPASSSTSGKPDSLDYDVLAFHQDSRGHLWAGTNGSGLIRFTNGKPALYTMFTEKNGLPNNYIFSICEDSRGNLWMSSYKGVFVLRETTAVPGAPQSDGVDFLTVMSFDEKEGMNSRECVMTGHPSAWKTDKGILYIPTVKGVAVFDIDFYGQNMASIRKPPPVIIENVIADNRPVSMAGTLPSQTQLVEFYFTALSFSAPDKVRIFYKLAGFDPQWREALERQNRTAVYVNLPAGDYCFNVIACNNDGVWNREGARFNFRVEASFYKRPVFYGLLLLLVCLIAGGIAWHRVARLKKKQAKTAEKEKPEPKEKYKTSALLPETVEQVLPRLTRLMEEEKVFLDPDLNLKKLSDRLHVHYNHLSRIINEHLGKSFNDYINSFRIEEAKKKLTDPREAGKTVLEIAYDTGFYSKSVFNTAFKKFTGMTPSQFRASRLNS